MVGLLDLPTELLSRILLLLCPLNLAAVRLACRALRIAATPSRRLVAFGPGFFYCATARASASLLQSMNVIYSLLERLDEEKKTTDGGHYSRQQGYLHTRCWLQTQLLASVAREVVSLKVHLNWRDHSSDAEKANLLLKPQHLFGRMHRLECLEFDDPVNRDVFRELPTLRSLKRLRLPSCDKLEHVQLVCCTMELTDLDLGEISHMRGYQPGLVLDWLAIGKTSGLQKLVFDLPSEEVQKLSSLTALTSLYLRVGGPPADFGGVASLTGLRSLQLRVATDPGLGGLDVYVYGQVMAGGLSPLSGLTGLTLLDVLDLHLGDSQDAEDDSVDITNYLAPPDVSVLSSLQLPLSLRVLRCGFYDRAEFVAEDPLPAQFRFLRSATAL